MPSLTYYYSRTDQNHQEYFDHLKKISDEYNLTLLDICIEEQESLTDKHQGKTPVLCIGPYVLSSPFSDTDLHVAIRSALSRHERYLKDDDQNYKRRLKNGLTFSRFDQFSYFFSKYYAIIISMIIFLYILIPFFAPVLAHNGFTRAANGIYKVYRVMCHQLAFRSFFLYGEQPYYPRELAGIEKFITYEEIINSKVIDLSFASSFIGNEKLGYKVAICQRDVAIYGSLVLFGAIFHFTGKKVKNIKWYWWLLFGLIPIGVDGLSQIPSLSTGWPSWFPVRESTPILRLITGSLFGLFTAWYLYPLMEESVMDTRVTLHRKKLLYKKLIEKKKSSDD